MQHGGDVYTEGILKGKEIIDFSSNINPLGVPKSYTNNIKEALEALNRYPDVKYRRLREYVKDYINNYEYFFYKNDNENKNVHKSEIVNEEDFIFGNNASEIIDLAISCFNNIMIPIPCFGEYQEDAKKWNENIIYVPSNKKLDYDYNFILDNLHKVDALILGNPNNPDGKLINKAKFKKILDYCENNNKKIIIDEAFIEFSSNCKYSFIKELKKYKCLFIIRALTKFYAMPGIRLGFGICKDSNFLNNMRKKQNPWNINCFAEVAAKYVLKDKQYIKQSVNWIKEEREFFTSELRKISFIENVYNTYSNFILCKLKNIDCNNLYDLCMKKNIAIRKCGNFKGLNNYYVRFAIKDRKKNLILINVLKAISKSMLLRYK